MYDLILIIVSLIFVTLSQYVYPYLYMEADESVQKSCCEYIESMTGRSIQNLICLSFKRIMIEILLYYNNNNEEKVKKALRFLMKSANQEKSSTRNDEDVVCVLIGFSD